MASILDLMNTTVGEIFLSKAGEKTSENKEKIIGVVGMAMPLLLGALKQNSATEDGANKLDKALKNEKHGENFLKNLQNVSPSEMVNEGGKITNQIFGGNENNIVQIISSILQMKETGVKDILQMSAPLVMSVLASQKEKENIDPSGLQELIDSVLGKSSQFDASLIDTLLSKDNASNVIHNAKNMILGGGTKGKKDGGILGGMLGSK